MGRTSGNSIMPETSTTGTTTLPASTINVSSNPITAGFSSSGTFTFNRNQVISYTGLTTSSFTGCSGGGVYLANTPVALTVSTTSNTAGTLPLVTINAASTGGFPPAGSFNIITSLGAQTVTYTVISPTSFGG